MVLGRVATSRMHSWAKKLYIGLALCGVLVIVAAFVSVVFNKGSLLGEGSSPKQLKKQNQVYDEARFDTASPIDNQKSLALSATAFISVYVDTSGKETILIEQNKDRELPIASMTKLTVALVASEQHADHDVIVISKDALALKGGSGLYTAGDSLYFSDSLHAVLIASHNEVASSIANGVSFIDAMNAKASSLHLTHTHYVNPTGLDPEGGSDSINESTAFDMYTLMRYLKEHNPEILRITTEKTFELKTKDGTFVDSLKSTNVLLGDSDLPFMILGGKTGETPRAKQNLGLITKSPCRGEIVSVVMGSANSFADMKQLLQYDENSFIWTCYK